MDGGETTDLGKLDAPWGREIVFQQVDYESGMKLLRIRIREGKRFTILDLDAPTAEAWGRRMLEWAEGDK
jgi:hypothetical protein